MTGRPADGTDRTLAAPPALARSDRASNPARLLMILIGLGALWPTALVAQDVDAGRQVAERWCARCHVIGLAKPYGGIDSSPTFFLMSEKLDDYRDRIRTFQERRPHKALEFDVQRADIEDLLAYIGVLERP